MAKKQQKNKLLEQLKKEWNYLELACKCIFIIGIVLLIQLIYAIFIAPDILDPSNQIVLRTSTASIFGFILGMGHSQSTQKESETKKEISNPPPSEDFLTETDIHLCKANTVRIIFSFSICLICIITLVIGNRINHLHYQEGITQIHDLISTTIGFLISKASKNR